MHRDTETDLRKMGDDLLNAEYNYVLAQCRAASARITEALQLLIQRMPLPIPLFDLHAEHIAHTNRFEEVMAEIQRRYIP